MKNMNTYSKGPGGGAHGVFGITIFPITSVKIRSL